MSASVKEKMPVHQWTNGGDEVLIVKVVDKDGKTSGDSNGVKWEFEYPLTVGASVTAPDWNTDKQCGSGLHGWAWGVGVGNGKRSKFDGSDKWIVIGSKPKDVINLDAKVKTKQAVVRMVGTWREALAFVRPGFYEWIKEISKSSPSASSGNSSTSASSGYSSTSASSGYSSTSASSGDYSTSASSGYYSTSASSGDYSTSASSGYYSTSASSGGYSTSASSGDYSTSKATGEASCAVCSGSNSKAMAGERGVIALAWDNPKTKKREMKCAQTGNGRGSLKANTLYELNSKGKFVEVKTK